VGGQAAGLEIHIHLSAFFFWIVSHFLLIKYPVPISHAECGLAALPPRYTGCARCDHTVPGELGVIQLSRVS
jgi:hypothetical protein